MKRTSPPLCILMTIFAAMATTHGSELITDDLNVFGTASFYGDVNIGWDAMVPTSGLSLYYTFDTDDGTNVYDSSGNGYTGVASGATWVSNGISGGAYYFDGSDDYISVGDILDISGSQTTITVCIWLKLVIPQTWTIPISKQQEAYPYTGWGISCSPSTNILNQIMESYPTRVEAESVSGTGTGLWVFICATLTASATNMATAAYLNGIKEAEDEVVGSYAFIDTSAPLTIGARDGGNLGHYQGYIDEVLIYNRELSAQEIAQLYMMFSRGVPGLLNVKDLIVDNELIQTGTGTNILMGPTGIGVTNPVGQLQVGGLLNVDGNIRLNDNWLSGDGDNEGVAVASNGRVTILELEPQGDISMGSYTNQP